MSATETKTYLEEPPTYDFKDLDASDRKDLINEVRSIGSTTTNATAIVGIDFTPSKTLLINARGIRLIRLPIPSGQLEIPITNTTGEIVYVSAREKRCSGNAVLHDAAGKALLASEYQFGPGREPKIRILDQEAENAATIMTKSKWTSRQQEFALPDGKSFTWRYVHEFDAAMSLDGKQKKRTYIVLDIANTTTIKDEEKSGKANRRRVAQLVRGEEARTPGTRSTDAGNGGRLQIDTDFCQSIGLRDDIIVASCLMMLKKEIDRRRIVQFMILASAAGS
jgi:hypothetical protein